MYLHKIADGQDEMYLLPLPTFPNMSDIIFVENVTFPF